MIQDDIRLLIVDDVPQVRQGLVTMLKLVAKNIRPGIQVVGEAKNGSEAIQQVQVSHPNVILMDLEMPVLDGYAATQSIKSANPSILIVALTIHNDRASRQKAFDSGVDFFIEKGAPLDELLQAIQISRRAT